MMFWTPVAQSTLARIGWGLVGIALLVTTGIAHGAPTNEQKQEIQSLRTESRKATNLIKQGKITESVEVMRSVQERLEKLSQGGNVAEIAADLDQLVEAFSFSHGVLELEGYTLKPLSAAKAMGGMDAMAGPAAPGTGPVPLPTMFPAAQLSFTRHIAPILIARCGNCHVTGSRGGFSASNFAALMRGTQAGVVIFPGDDSGSRLIETIESGDMPRGGGQVSPAELTALKTWIKEGAAFDGSDPQTSISQGGGAATPAMPRLEVTVATGNEKTSFGRDVAGIFQNRCVSCHNANNDGGNLSMESFTRFLRGGDSGAPIVPGKPAESMLVKLIKAEAPGDRMPRNGPALSAEEIAKIESWIAEGAAFDGDNPGSSMARTHTFTKALEASHDELLAMRETSSATKWELGLPNVESAKIESEHFLVYSISGEEAAKELGEQADKVADRVRGLLKAPANQPLIKGRMTFYFLRQRYDYAEFGNMVERREIPSDWRGHWWYDVTDAYAAVQIPTQADYDLDTLLAQQIAGAHVASIGDGRVPRWFSEGAARVIASRFNAKDVRVTQWNDSLSSSVASLEKADDFLRSRLSPEQNDVVSYGFMKAIMGRGNGFETTLGHLREGDRFESAFQKGFKYSPAEMAAWWVPTVK
ncbi:MAG: c-type cytochrome domain-containing protein [Pirellulaceae bacterium]